MPSFRVAAVTFETHLTTGIPTRWGAPIAEVCGPLKTTVLLVENGRSALCFVSSACFLDGVAYSNVVRARMGMALGLKPDQIAVFSTHNHSTALVAGMSQFAGTIPDESAFLAEAEMTDFGRTLLRQLEEAAAGL